MKQKLGVPVILLQDRQVILAKRIGIYGAGKYGFPGGHLDELESIDECARRELLEEVGIVATDLRTIGVVKEWQTTHWFIHFISLCTAWTGEITNLEPTVSEAWQWYSLDDLPQPLVSGHQLGLQLLDANSEWLIEG